MGTVGIVVGLIFRQFLIDGGDRQGPLIERVELITAGAVGALHTAVVLLFRGQHICLLPGMLKIPEFRAAVHLERADGKRRLFLKVGQKPFGIAAGGPTIHLQPAPFADRTGGLELFHTRPLREADAHVVRLHQLPRFLRLHPVTPAFGMVGNCRRRLGFTWP